MPVPVPTGRQSPTPAFSDGVNMVLRYDNAGNSYIQGVNGEWIPHHGYAKVVYSMYHVRSKLMRVPYQALPLTSQQTGQQELDTRSQWPSEPMSHAFEVHSST